VQGVDTEAAVQALITDLRWQIDQLGTRGIKTPAGRRYDPSHYRRGLENAIDDGGVAVVEFVRTFLHKAPTESFRKLEKANALDLASEALVADEDRPYAGLFSDEDRAAARRRLEPHLETIQARTVERRARIDAQRKKLRAQGMPRRSELDSRIRARRGF
jgi:hypothetical protein